MDPGNAFCDAAKREKIVTPGRLVRIISPGADIDIRGGKGGGARLCVVLVWQSQIAIQLFYRG
jgi:hypothetical protein